MNPLIRAEVVIGENTKQLLIERNVQLDQPAIKVRNINASIREITTDVILDKVVIQGVLHKQLFYVGEDHVVHHQAEDIPFSTFVDIPGAEMGMNVDVNPQIETVIFNLLTDSIVHQKVVIEIFVKVTETRQLNVEIGDGPLLSVDQVVGENTKQELFESFVTLENPAIKIDDITVKIQNLDMHIIEGKVIIQGVIHKQIFYIGTDNIEYHQAEDVEFSTFIDIPGATPGMDVEVIPTIEFVHFELLDEYQLLQKVVVEFFAKITENVQLNLVLGPDVLLKVEVVIGENTTQILEENAVTLPINTIKVREIVASIQDITTEVITDKVIIQGIIHKQIFFIGEDNLEHHLAEDIPFSTFVDIIGASPDMNVRVDARIETILFELEDERTLRQKVVIEFFVKVTETEQLSLTLVSPYGSTFF